jgi:hypothetical protein
VQLRPARISAGQFELTAFNRTVAVRRDDAALAEGMSDHLANSRPRTARAKASRIGFAVTMDAGFEVMRRTM